MPDVLPDMYFRAFQVDIFNSQSRLHVAQRKDGSLLAWRNWRVVPVNAPEVGSYGQELAITDINSLSISLATQTASSPGGNVLTFAGTLSPDGSSIEVKQATNGVTSPSCCTKASERVYITDRGL